MSNQKYDAPSGPPPPREPAQVYHDAGPYYPPDNQMEVRGNQYPQGPDPNGYYQQQQQQGWNQGPPGPWPPQGQQPYGYPPPQQGMYYQQGPPGGYVDDRGRGSGAGAAGGCCAALLAAMTCCCCLELLF